MTGVQSRLREAQSVRQLTDGRHPHTFLACGLMVQTPYPHLPTGASVAGSFAAETTPKPGPPGVRPLACSRPVVTLSELSPRAIEL